MWLSSLIVGVGDMVRASPPPAKKQAGAGRQSRLLVIDPPGEGGKAVVGTPCVTDLVGAGQG